MTVIEEIIAERKRQIEAEGFTHDDDDVEPGNKLPHAALCYAAVAGDALEDNRLDTKGRSGSFSKYWPWDMHWWKPTDARRDLIKAAALCVAAIERIDRLSAKGKL